MRLSSSTSDQPVGGLFGGVLSRGAAATRVNDLAWLSGMLTAEAALARALADCAVIPEAAADAIEAACSDVSAYDVDAIGAAAAETGNPVVPLVGRIRELVGTEHAEHVHAGATSQDIVDTAMMLVARSAGSAVVADLGACADAAARLAEAHRDHAVMGRTLMQAAVPTTFGLTAATWSVGLDAVGGRLAAVLAVLPAQLGGAAGTLAGMAGMAGIADPAVALEVAQRYADAVGLLAAPVPWHTLRLPVAELAGALGSAAGVVGKVALDVVLLAQTEVGEVTEGVAGRGGSSTMAHKNNPVAAISARAAALRVPGLVATVLAGLPQEHQRAAGAWHAEWETVSDLLRITGSAASWLSDCLGHLTVDVDRMRAGAEAGSSDGIVDTGAAGLLVDHVLGVRTEQE